MPTQRAPRSLAELRLMKLQALKAVHVERARRASEAGRRMDVFGKLGYVPTPKQAIFHGATEFSVLYGGSLGGGKTRALVAGAILACVRHPGIRVGAFRRSYPELKESLLAELAEMDFAAGVGAVWNGSAYELRFANGSLIMFRYAETLQDATRRQGGQYQMLVFDELTLTPPDVVTFLESRLRSGRSDLPVLGFRASANPGGPGHGYVRARFIDSTNYGANIISEPDSGTSLRFVPSSMKDNPHLDQTYRDRLNALPEAQRRAFRDGDWSVFAGQMFSELSRDRHVLEPITLPATWQRYTATDWGYSAPWATLWAAVDEDHRAWVYREIYRRHVGEADQAKQILEAEAPDERIAARYADDAMWAVRGDARPISDIYREAGVWLTEAGKGSRVTGWQRVRSYLAEGPACPHHRAQGWETCPKIHIFSTCTELFRELRDLPHASKGNPEDADTNASDHASDALRYLLINLGGGPEFPIINGPAAGNSLDPQPLPGLPFYIAPRAEQLYTIDDFVPGATAPWQE